MSGETDTGGVIMLVAVVSLYSTGHWIGATVLMVLMFLIGRTK